MQIHYSCLRNPNRKMFEKLGADTGFDMIAVTDGSVSISSLLSKLTETDECPRTILYSLNPSDFDMLGTMIGSFQGDEVPGKIQLGSAWWFCDTNDRHEPADAHPGSSGPAGQLHRHAHRQPQLPELHPPRAVPPPDVQSGRLLGGKRSSIPTTTLL